MTRRQIRKYIHIQLKTAEASGIEMVSAFVSETIKSYITRMCDEFLNRITSQSTINFSTNWHCPEYDRMPVYELARYTFTKYTRLCASVKRVDQVPIINMTNKIELKLLDLDDQIANSFRNLYKKAFTDCLDPHEVGYRLECIKKFKKQIMSEYEKLVVLLVNSMMVFSMMKL